MSFSTRIAHTALWALIGLSLGCSDGAAGAPGKQGTPGADGKAGTPGAPGSVPTLKNDVTGTVTDGANALANVGVTAEPGGATATTGANGAFTLPGLGLGAYELTFHLDGYVDQTVSVTVASAGPSTVMVALVPNEGGAAAPTVSVTDQLAVGFDQPVTLNATAMGKGTLTYAWKQLGGPPVVLSGGATATPSFTTQDFASAMGPMVASNARFDVIGVNPDQAGNYVFEVTVTDTLGQSTKATAHVDATRTTSGLRMVPVGMPVWLQGDGPLVSAAQKTWNWTIDTSGAPGSAATLSNPSSQFPSFKPDVKGTYKLTETVANKSLSVYAGTWLGEMTSDSQDVCTLCHNDSIAPNVFKASLWAGTKHHDALQHALDGDFGPGFAESELASFTVGYDKTAANDGFDDVQASVGWSFPATLKPGNWDALLSTPQLGQLAGIQCESCHGPQGADVNGPHANVSNKDLGARISWSSEVCAKCHQQGPSFYNPAQWLTSKHADLTLSYLDATVEGRGVTAAHCGRCHSAQGFAQYADGLKQGYSGQLTSDGKPAAAGNPPPNVATLASLTALGLTRANVESQTCVACHDPHDATNPSQLRLYDGVPSLPNGMNNVSGAGAGMICIACHNTRNGEHSDFVAAPASFSAPHTPAQVDTVYGFNAYYVNRYNPSPHLAVNNTCVGCHAEVPTGEQKAVNQATNHTFKVDTTICAACHGNQVDGVALQAAYGAQLDALGVALHAKVLNLINKALLPANGGAYTVRVWDPVSDQYSSAAASNVSLVVAPTSLESFEVHGTVGYIMHMPAPFTVGLVDAAGNPNGSITTSDLYVASSSLKNAAAAATLFPANSDYFKASWNYYLLKADNTKGVHNPGFYDAVLGATNAKVNALP